ncbi:RNA 2',3'-cyclic phosphodiesterase [Noviherbaspirillum aerium]|uniref:RNA 2',3'-cyclic phosphodiesterase n=1 Tax=Noviherbaspirillum aerium TaxID=2588497 RepID=UPI00124C1512|nr:RNA 2',3'-cyclic phosphodiesterase [Noviherbaspirillum aerium]
MSINTNEKLRLFFALWPGDEVRTALMQLQAPMQGRWIPYGNLHLTLAFLGMQPASVITTAKEILAHLQPRDDTLIIDKVGYFPRNRVAWAGTHQLPQGLAALEQELFAALNARGITYDRHSEFKPHITLARDATLPADVVFEPIAWRADTVALVQSTTGSGGSVYEVLASRSLREPAQGGIAV